MCQCSYNPNGKGYNRIYIKPAPNKVNIKPNNPVDVTPILVNKNRIDVYA